MTSKVGYGFRDTQDSPAHGPGLVLFEEKYHNPNTWTF